MVIADRAKAEQFFAHVNYYRLSGYCLAFEQSRHAFAPDTSFEAVRYAYEFDWSLRDLLNEALEVIEVDLRAVTAHHFGKQYGAFGHTVNANFYKFFDLTKIRDETQRSSEPFVQHFRATYLEYPDLPVWAVTEIMSLGTLSKMIYSMHRRDQIALATRYGQFHSVFVSWAHHMLYIRNLCAHHARVWDRAWPIKPILPRDPAWAPPLLPQGDRLMATLLVLASMLKGCPTATSFRNQWISRIENLLAKPPACKDPLFRMGLTAKWFEHPAWR